MCIAGGSLKLQLARDLCTAKITTPAETAMIIARSLVRARASVHIIVWSQAEDARGAPRTRVEHAQPLRAHAAEITTAGAEILHTVNR